MLNFLFKIISSIRKLYWFMRRPITTGVKILAISGNKVLLVKNRYEKFWYLPGGGIKKGETSIESAKREMREECSIILDNLRIIGTYSNFSEYKKDSIFLIHSDVTGLMPIKGFEIEKLEFFDMENLPDNVSSATKRRIREFLSGKIDGGIW
ncbi:MAG: NUDIX domain-containing protein [Patescibacteria group bacterium]